MPADPARLERVRQLRRVLATSGPSDERADGDFARISLPLDDCDVLRDLLIGEHARVVIEIGLAYGSSALAIEEALVTNGHDDACHLIVDAFQSDFHDAGWNVIVAAGVLDVCQLVRERSQSFLPRLVSEGFVADAAFVDGSHVFHNVFVDLFFLRELVRPGGLIILDDCDWPSVGAAVRYFEVNAGWEAEAPFGSRLRGYRLPNPRSEPRFEDFTPF
jgi:predicted O-methyltransferase YrrM